MRYEQLISLAERLIKSFNPITLTPDSHCEEFMRTDGKKLFDTEQTFLRQVFSGVVRYEEFLRILTNALFNSSPGTTNRNDATLYFIFGYIIVFRLDELPLAEFKKMVNEQNPVKMNVFLQFLFDVTKLEMYVKPGWNEIYDPDYIQNTVIGGIEGHLPLMKDLLSSISSKATEKKSDLVTQLEDSMLEDEQSDDGKNKPQHSKRQPTKQQPFKLTQAKVKEIPEPIVIPKVVKSNPVPKNLNKKSLKQLEDEKQRRLEDEKQAVLKQYKEGKQQPFEFRTEKRPNNIEKVKQRVEEELSAQLQFNKKIARPMPKDLEPAEIKLNAAAILREEILLQKKQEIERRRVRDLEVNMRDSGEFEEWQEQMRDKDQLAQLEHQQRKKVEMELAREAAMRAQEDKFVENKLLVERIKHDTVIRLAEREELQKEEVEHKRKLIEQVTEDAKQVAIEKEKMIERNKKMVEDTKMDMAKLLERKRIEDEQLRLKREELIKQIRELEKQPRKRTKGYDPTETMGIGLLEEMSLAELRERLDQVKLQQKREEEDRRQQNTQKRDEYLSSLQRKVHDIKAHRVEQQEFKNMERESKRIKKEKEAQLRKDIREQQLVEVQGLIKDKKTKKQLEEERIAREVKETRLKQQYMNANKAMVEEKAWKSQQDGLEREIKERQNEKLIVQERVEGIKNKERTILANAAKTLVQSKVDFNKQYDNTLSKAYQDNDKLNSEERANKTRNYQQARNWELDHTKNMVERDQFKSKLAQESLENSRKKQQQGHRSHSATNNIRLPSPKYNDQVKVAVDVA